MSTKRSFVSVEPVTAAVSEVLPGAHRITLGAPGVGHVHCYLLAGEEGALLVDAGAGGRGAEEAWRGVIARVGARVRAVVVTHMHVDHLGGVAAAASAAGGVPVLQGRLDAEQAREVYGDPAWPRRVARHAAANGLPAEQAAAAEAAWRSLTAFGRPVPAEPLDPGDRVDGWEVVALPGHADGHIGLLRGGVLVGGDVLLEGISPQIGVWPGADSDPLGRYLDTLERLRRRPPRVVLPGHGEPVAAPAARAAEIAAHHRLRLDAAAAALGPRPRTAHEVSLALWPAELDPLQRALAVSESLAHLERLAREGRARPAAAAPGRRGFTAPAAPPRSRGAAPSR